MKTIEAYRAERAALRTYTCEGMNAEYCAAQYTAHIKALAEDIETFTKALADLNTAGVNDNSLYGFISATGTIEDNACNTEGMPAWFANIANIVSCIAHTAEDSARRVYYGAENPASADIAGAALNMRRMAAELENAIAAAPYEEKSLLHAASALYQLSAVAVKVMEDNTRAAFFSETLPAVVKILQKYNGKAYGPKTQSKIRAEVLESAEAYFYMSYNGYCVSASVSPLNRLCHVGSSDNYNFRFYHSDAAPLTADNKINAIPAEAFRPYGSPKYYPLPFLQAFRILEAFDAMKAAEEALQKTISSFNGVIPSGIERAYTARLRSRATDNER